MNVQYLYPSRFAVSSRLTLYGEGGLVSPPALGGGVEYPARFAVSSQPNLYGQSNIGGGGGLSPPDSHINIKG